MKRILNSKQELLDLPVGSTVGIRDFYRGEIIGKGETGPIVRITYHRYSTHVGNEHELTTGFLTGPESGYWTNSSKIQQNISENYHV